MKYIHPSLGHDLSQQQKINQDIGDQCHLESGKSWDGEKNGPKDKESSGKKKGLWKAVQSRRGATECSRPYTFHCGFQFFQGAEETDLLTGQDTPTSLEASCQGTVDCRNWSETPASQL